MEAYKLCVKFFADGAADLPLDTVVPVFHTWIRDQSLPDHLLIDVADYAHVPDGPGTVLVAHEANIHFDREDGEPGVTYIRKQPIDDAKTFRQRLDAVFLAALLAASKFESESTLGVKFRADELVFRINDRLLAPNTEATFKKVSPDLQKFAGILFQGDVALEHRHDAERLFEVRIKSTARASISELLMRLERSAAPAVTVPAR